jgi:hypothetical protein
VSRSRGIGEADRLLAEYTLYDEHVDVVSAFECLFTGPKDMAATVRHFERFPKISVDGQAHTPDFTVLFTDDTALVGEISNLALHEGSVDKACRQLGRYAILSHVPDETGRPVRVAAVDVVQYVPMRIGPDAVRRVISERMLNPQHDYNPPAAPCIVQYARDSERYMFQRISDAVNGCINGHGREPHLGARIGSLNVPAALFAATKANRQFINDPVPALYMAVHLYTHTWPTQYGSRKDEITVIPSETAQILRQEFRVGSKEDIRRALELLVAAGLAADNKDGTWVVSPKPPRVRGGDRDLAQVLAKKAAEKPAPIVRSARAKRAPRSEQESLF